MNTTTVKIQYSRVDRCGVQTAECLTTEIPIELGGGMTEQDITGRAMERFIEKYSKAFSITKRAAAKLINAISIPT